MQSGVNFNDALANEYCNKICVGNSDVAAINSYYCCRQNCFTQMVSYSEGSYCDDAFNVYNSWLDYCIAGVCAGEPKNAVFCAESDICTLQLCNAQLVKAKCAQSYKRLTITISDTGECKLYDSLCEAEYLRFANETIVECDSTNIDDCADYKYIMSIYMGRTRYYLFTGVLQIY